MSSVRKKRQGFTLVEMSIVLIVIGLVILTVFPAMKAVRDGQQRAATASNLQTLMRATAAFIQASGCLPCPTPASTVGAGFGFVRGESGAATCGVCNAPEGIPPFASLGLPAASAKDGWSRWITMRIDKSLANPLACGSSCTLTKLCQQAALSTTSRVFVSTPGGPQNQTAAVIFMSHGPDGFGAFQTFSISGMGSDDHVYNGPASAVLELENADGDASFTDAPITSNPTDPFDDVMTYMDLNALVAFLGQGACQTTW